MSGDRSIVVILLCIAVPCLLGAGYMGWRSLQYQWLGTRAEGRIVELHGDVPQITVEYDAGLDEPLLAESFGSDLYAGFAVGDAVAVYFDPKNPRDARLDLFVENWLLPLLLGGFGLFWLLPLPLMWRGH